MDRRPRALTGGPLRQLRIAGSCQTASVPSLPLRLVERLACHPDPAAGIESCEAMGRVGRTVDGTARARINPDRPRNRAQPA